MRNDPCRPDGAYMTAQGQVFSLMKRHMGNRLCLASLETVVTMDKDGKVVVTVVNSSFQNHKTVDFTQYGPCCQAVLYSSDTVLPPPFLWKQRCWTKFVQEH